jgi:hypothetical protein
MKTIAFALALFWSIAGSAFGGIGSLITTVPHLTQKGPTIELAPRAWTYFNNTEDKISPQVSPNFKSYGRPIWVDQGRARMLDRTIRMENRGIQRSMQDINSSIMRMNSDINRLRTLQRRY